MIPFKFFRFFLCFLSFIFINYTKAQNISVDTSLSARQLVDKFIGAQNASCITVSNVSVSGWNFGGNDPSYGYFIKNGSTFDIDEGIILSTGSARAAEGPNTTLQSNYDSNWPAGDPDLVYTLTQAGLPTDNILNATYLEFDFVSLQSDKISFDYMFLSEEYRDSNCRYSDAFAFLIKKANTTDPYQNIALIPGTNTPVTSLSINGATSCPRNIDYFGGFNGTVNPTNFNGQTKVLKAITTVQKGVTYHIKLVIADHGDANGLYDSAVFLKSGSFTGNIDIGKDLTLGNEDPLCENVPYRIQPNPAIGDPSAKYSWFKNGQPLTVPATQAYYDVVNDEGDFSVSVTLGSGCRLEGNVKIEKAPVANVNNAAISVCDNDFDGKYSAILSNFNNQIVTNYSRDFNISYSLSPTGVAIDPDSDFIFTQNPQNLYVKVGTYSCTPKLYTVQFYSGTKLNVTSSIVTQNICDDDISGSQDINLADYLTLITNETGFNATYFATEAQAKLGGNSTVTSSQTINSNKSFFIRIEKAGFCPNYKEIKLNFKQPKESISLKNIKTAICKGVTITLDAGTGFTSYEWSTGAKTQSIPNVSAGDYWVKLGFNGCVHQQFVKITEAADPVIDDVLIEGTTVTVMASGGTPPYSYALDNGNYQSSNVFTNVDLGSHTVHMKDAAGCSETTKDISLINTQNVITPNGDGINDVIDYSSLLMKTEPRFEIYDRNGILVFKGDTNNQFIWNGNSNGRILPTSTYWYILEWNENGNPNRTQFSGWILLKNRN